MEKLLETGKTKAIGLSNYSVKFLEELLPHCSVVPAANQIENRMWIAPITCAFECRLTFGVLSDPYLPQQEIADFCNEKGILIEAYSPLGSTGSPLFKEAGVEELAKKHNVGLGTVLISYQGMLLPSI